MSQNYFYPPSGGGSSNASVGLNGSTAPSSSTEVAGINPSGNQQPLQTDANGALITTPATGSVQHVIVDSSALPTGASTSANQTTANTALTLIAANQTNGTQVVSVSNFPATQPVSGTVTANQGTAGATAWKVDGSGVTQPISGTVSVSNFPTTQAISAASLPLPTGAATAALQQQTQAPAGTSASEATAIQGISGGLAVPVSISSIPIATGASTAALQSSTQAAAGASSSAATGIQGVAGGLNVPTSHVDVTPSTQNITILDSGSTTVAGYLSQSLITGTPTAGSAASFAVASQESLAIEIKGTWTGTLQSEVSIDGGTTWTPHSMHQFGASNYVTTVTGNFIASLNMAGKTNWRLRAIATTTGTAAVTVVESLNPSTVYIANSIKLVDSTAAASPPGATIKAASTAAVATDPALVVAISPNNPITATSTPTKGTLTDGSGATSATPSTSTTLMAVNASRKYLIIQNLSSSATIYINFTSAATIGSGSLPLLPYATFAQESGFISTEAITVISATASVPYTAKQA